MGRPSKPFTGNVSGRIRPHYAVFIAVLALCMMVQAWSLVPMRAASATASNLQSSAVSPVVGLVPAWLKRSTQAR